MGFLPRSDARFGVDGAEGNRRPSFLGRAGAEIGKHGHVRFHCFQLEYRPCIGAIASCGRVFPLSRLGITSLTLNYGRAGTERHSTSDTETASVAALGLIVRVAVADPLDRRAW